MPRSSSPAKWIRPPDQKQFLGKGGLAAVRNARKSCAEVKSRRPGKAALQTQAPIQENKNFQVCDLVHTSL
jgi:hypothetical protein